MTFLLADTVFFGEPLPKRFSELVDQVSVDLKKITGFYSLVIDTSQHSK